VHILSIIIVVFIVFTDMKLTRKLLHTDTGVLKHTYAKQHLHITKVN